MGSSEYSDTKGVSTEGESDVATPVTLGDWEEREERQLVRKIDMRCMVCDYETELLISELTAM